MSYAIYVNSRTISRYEADVLIFNCMPVRYDTFSMACKSMWGKSLNAKSKWKWNKKKNIMVLHFYDRHFDYKILQALQSYFG